ncbi:RecQ family ATP-dependent DNA helicase [Weeksellaceae bacterium TAE3-ERU29]|nr:RecQ family ATP-dependent DNA helicase [Weeksellaceae bacterium TAE3-ERU29]
MKQKPTEILSKYWGYSEFRFPQKEIIQNIIEGKDTFALLPTGGGKSLCFQIPVLTMDGLCLVISPLVALMKDQVQSLKKKGIKAELLSSELTPHDIDILLDNCRFGGVKLLYISPERLSQKSFREKLKYLNIAYFAIDEAHCISEWGHDFRPSYLALKTLKEEYPKKPILALTATATPKIKNDILKQLNIENATVFQKSLQRKNLAYRIHESSDKLKDLEYYLKKYKGSSIVFCKTRKQTYEVSTYLSKRGFNANYYHARLSKEEKNKRQKDFINSHDLILVSTNAFGMGIDKPDVRLVIHYEAPSTIESYFQEVGRGGRDGNPATGILLYNETDKKNALKQFKAAMPKKEEFLNIIKKLYNYFQVGDNEFFTGQHSFSEKKFREVYKLYKPKVRQVLMFLEKKNIIKIHRSQRQSLVKIEEENYNIKEDKSTESKVLSYIARHYGGIFQEPKPIDEYFIATRLNITKSEVKEALKTLNKNHKIYYRDAAIVKLEFLTPREDNLAKIDYWKEFYNHHILKWQRLNDLFFFIENTEYCKSSLLLRYFGEKETEKCGVCNVCSPSEGLEKLNEKELFEYLQDSPKTQDEILEQFIQYDFDAVLSALQNLLDEEKIKFTLPNYYSV